MKYKIIAIANPEIIAARVSIFIDLDKISGVDLGIRAQFSLAPATIAATARLILGVVSAFVLFSRLIRGLLKFGLTSLERVNRTE